MGWHESLLTQEARRLVRRQSYVIGTHVLHPERLAIDVVHQVVIQSRALPEIEVHFYMRQRTAIAEGGYELAKAPSKAAGDVGHSYISGSNDLPLCMIVIRLALG